MVAGDRSVIVTARTVADAVEKAARRLGVAPGELQIEVQGARRTGFLGLGTPELMVLARIPAPEPSARPGLVESAEAAGAAPSVETSSDAPAAAAPRWIVWCEAGDCMFRTNSRGVVLERVEETIRGWPFDEYFGDGLRAAVLQSNDANVIIGRVTPPADLTAETAFFLKIPGDDMSVWAIPGHHPFDDTVTAGELLAALQQKGVTHGIDKQAIEALDGRKLTRPTLIARGFDGSPSRDSAVEFLFPDEDPDVVLRPLIREDGTVDYRDLIRLHTVPSGTVLGRYLPATAGEPRRDVFGRETPHKTGNEVPPQRFAGPNVSLAANGTDYIAARAGRPLREKGRIEVMEVYAIQGDVDFSTGNVDFKG
ncbi:MAG: FapA family protein, partial [Chloroflexota bacterium]|nr:FapA family protein [Chloroflexota bacterium]